ncbi:hypothetical protein O181_107622 [Austropuccinia psidii MF-1]|uniref:Uncharacterized protein n=1 Tax=Austropuccinia psidii MF-1 TaxID=1389203 RepID=A0A9Q3PPJ7_9BASI|nr:hypothetical protein [Austropuccinia psidii MF-1]
MTKLPCQQPILTPSKDHIIIKFGCNLQVFDAANGNLILSTLSTSNLNPQGSNHTGFIRLLAIHHQSLLPNSNQSLKLISTGEDKLLKIWKLPNLKLIKRPTSIAISPNEENIIIADKFGDVYDLPFDAPLQTIFQSDPDQEQISEKIEKSISLDQTSTKTDPWPLKETWFSKSCNNKRRRAQDKSINDTEDASGKQTAEETKQVKQTSKLIQRTCINKFLFTQSSPHDKENYVFKLN